MSSPNRNILGLPNGTQVYQWSSLIPHLQNLQWEKALKWQQAVCIVDLKSVLVEFSINLQNTFGNIFHQRAVLPIYESERHHNQKTGTNDSICRISSGLSIRQNLGRIL